MYTDQDIANLVARVQVLEAQIANKQNQSLPNTALISKNFLTRAFAVWGHYFVSSLLIGIAVSCIAAIIGLILGGSILSIFQNISKSIGL